MLKSKHYVGQNVAKNVVESVGKVSKSNLSQINKKREQMETFMS